MGPKIKLDRKAEVMVDYEACWNEYFMLVATTQNMAEIMGNETISSSLKTVLGTLNKIKDKYTTKKPVQ